MLGLHSLGDRLYRLELVLTVCDESDVLERRRFERRDFFGDDSRPFLSGKFATPQPSAGITIDSAPSSAARSRLLCVAVRMLSVVACPSP